MTDVGFDAKDGRVTVPINTDQLSSALTRLNLLPFDTEEVLRQNGGLETANNLVTKLVREKMAGGLFFAAAAGLARYRDLPIDVKDWFHNRGLRYFPKENIQVNLRHNHDTDLGNNGCHEVGYYVVHGVPGVYVSRPDEPPPPSISRRAFTAHDSDEKNPRGAWASVNVWNRLHYTVANAFVAGGGENARGILVPAFNAYPEDGVGVIHYWHTPHSFEEGAPQRNFFLRRSAHPSVQYGLDALARHLHGDIPAK